MFEYIGAIHVHSAFSDGSGQADEIAGLANEVGLDYLILTDHNTLRALKEGFEGWYGNTLLLVGCEINDKENKNHYLAFGTDKTFSTRIPAAEYVRLVKEDGGIGFLAHPHEKRQHMKEHPPYPWTEWQIEDFTGIEIWNHMSEWMENLTEQNKYQNFMHPLKSIIAPPKETLKVWDELNQKRRVVGIGGIDAHAHKQSVLGFMEVEVFPYKVLFKSIRTHILTDEKLEKSADNGNLEKNKKILLSALENGRCFFANSYHGDARGFRLFAEYDGAVFNMGDELNFKGSFKLKISVPHGENEIRLIRNGEEYRTINKNESEICISESGAYRAEVYNNKNAWIFSNHIRAHLIN
jgi:hypothetical protein